MKRASIQIERLETRRLFNLAAFGAVRSSASDPINASGQVATAPNGNFITAANGAIQRYTSSGVAFGPAIANSNAGSTTARFGLDSAGDIAIAYQDNPGGTPTLYVQRITATNVVGSPVIADRVAGTTSNSSIDSIAISMDANGGFYVGDVVSQSTGFDVRLRAYDASATPRGDAFSVGKLGYSDGYVGPLTIESSPDGSKAAFSTFQSFDDDLDQFDSDGLVTSSGQVAYLKGFDTNTPNAVTLGSSFAFGADNMLAVTYRGSETLQGPVNTAWFQRFDSSGNSLGDPTQLDADVTLRNGSAYDASVIAQSGGGFLVTFAQGSGQNSTLYAEQFNAAGKADDSGLIDVGSGVSGSLRPDGGGNYFLTMYGTGSSTITTLRLTTQIAAIDGSTLCILGTPHSESISIKQKGGSLFAALNNVSVKFAASAIRAVDFEGNNGNDRIYNETALPSTINGGRGNDEISGGSGVDLVHGDDGDDHIVGNDGNDQLFADDGNDSIDGDDGNDLVNGGDGNDNLYGKNGRDTVYGGDGNDLVLGGTGNDSLDGQAGNDRESGDAGNDTIDGGTGNDTLYGGDGNDLLVSYDKFADRVFGEGGTNKGDVDSTDRLTDIQLLK